MPLGARQGLLPVSRGGNRAAAWSGKVPSV